MAEERVRVTDASVLAYELRDFHKIMAGYRGGFTMEPDAMPSFVAVLDEFACRAERILAVEDACNDRVDLKEGIARVQAILAAADVQSQLFDAALVEHDAALREAVQSGKAALLRPTPDALDEAIGSTT